MKLTLLEGTYPHIPFSEFQLTDCNSEAVQAIRLFIDVLFLGPLLIYIGLNPGKQIPREASFFLVVIGVLTIVFNGINFFEIERRK